jgi:pyruvate,orthophosphate dikinase
MSDTTKHVYFFGAGKSEGSASMRELLGGKGANLADMAELGLPVPPGFTITTEACAKYYELGRTKLFDTIRGEVESALKTLEESTGKTFGKGPNPLLVSVRSGAAASMPGMMDTVLNLGLNDETAEALLKLTGNEHFVKDSQRRFIQMYGNVVLGVDHAEFEHELDKVKRAKGVTLDSDLAIADLEKVIQEYLSIVEKKTGKPFPQDPVEQLWGGIESVFASWNNPRAVKYRELNDIRNLRGTAVNVQSMVYGNMGANSATGVAFSRDPSTGANDFFYGEYLINAQGEDVVAGIRTPQQISVDGSREWAKAHGVSEEERAKNFTSLEEIMPEIFAEFDGYREKLERHYKDMQDMEFTIENGKLYMLQTRGGKRTAAAAVRIATDLVNEGLIDEATAVMRVDPNQLDQLLHPVFKKGVEDEAEKSGKMILKGLNASPGAASGRVVFTAADAESWEKRGEKVILVRKETSPEDIAGMVAAQGILTATGGMTSHAAVVARGMGKCCVAGAGSLLIDYAEKVAKIAGKNIVLKEGDWISLNGSTGIVYAGELETEDPELVGAFSIIMDLADKFRHLGVRMNADTPGEAERGVRFGAEGIGLCRTEHMFFDNPSNPEGRTIAIRRLILVADTVKKLRQEYALTGSDEERADILERLKAPEEQYNAALEALLPLQRKDFVGILEALDGRPCTIRLLDPPLHEFMPHSKEGQEEMAKEMGLEVSEVKALVDSLHEFNPMLGHRGCRLGMSYPEVTAMQVRAICEAAIKVPGSRPEIMIPLVGDVKELTFQKEIALKTISAVELENSTKLDIKIGTMIEVPRAAITADKIAMEADFFSFGTNDLTQMGMGFSRDDAGRFIEEYVQAGIYEYDPFQVLDQEGIGGLVKIAAERGRMFKPDLKLGICGEHGGEPRSVEFCHRVGLNYVSCSPFRVPIARLAAAQAAIKEAQENKA